MDDEEFIPIEESQPVEGQYCELQVISYFKGWYMPSCKKWSWLMDENTPPLSEVEAWRPANEKGESAGYEYLQSDDVL